MVNETCLSSLPAHHKRDCQIQARRTKSGQPPRERSHGPSDARSRVQVIVLVSTDTSTVPLVPRSVTVRPILLRVPNEVHDPCRVECGAGVHFLRGRGPPPPMPDARRLHSIDVFQLEYTDDVQISPDGSRIVYVRVSHDIMTDRARRNLWMVDADGTNNRPLRSESQNFSSPRWSPDGTRLRTSRPPKAARSSTCAGWTRGKPRLLTNLVEAPGAIAWSPDGRSIAFTQLVPVKSRRWPRRPRSPRVRSGRRRSRSSIRWSIAPTARATSRPASSTCSSSRPKAARRASSPTVSSTTAGRCPSRPTENTSCFPRIATRTGSAIRRTASVQPGRRHPELTQLTTRKGPDNSPGGVTRRPENRLPGLRRPSPGLPGHSSICDGH